jgi:hypothetical protein
MELWLDSIFANFNRYIEQQIITDNSIEFICFLTERLSENYFDQIKIKNSFGKYKIELKRSDYESIKITSPVNQIVTIYQGQQVAANQGIEVLALGKKVFSSAPDLTASEIIKIINKNNAICVLPWSFGKWHGKRLKVVQDCIAENKTSLFMGDIFGRNQIFGSNFDKVKNYYNIEVLSGSDPLPIKNEERYIASKVTAISKNSINDFDEIVPKLCHHEMTTLNVRSLELNKASLLTIITRQLALRF